MDHRKKALCTVTSCVCFSFETKHLKRRSILTCEIYIKLYVIGGGFQIYVAGAVGISVPRDNNNKT